MTLILELSDSKEAKLNEKAKAHGVSAEKYATQLLERELDAQPVEGESDPFWKTFTKDVHALPDEVFSRLPADGASEHDHYLYGSPKRNA